MDIETLVRTIVRIQTVVTLLNGPCGRLQENDITPEGSAALRQIREVHGQLYAVLLDLTDAVRDRQPMALRRIAQ